MLGFSTGGRVAMHFLDKHPAQVRRLVLASTTAYQDFAGYLEGWDDYHRRVRQQLPEDQIDGDTFEPWARNGASTAIWDLSLLPEYLELLDRVRFSGTWGAAHPDPAETLHPWCPGDPVGILRQARKPVLVLHGEKDMGFPVQVAHRLHEELPGSELAVVDGAAHQCQFEKPDVWARHVREFLDANAGSDRPGR
nr:alpha/beta hydrolase [Actinopolymorpha rutila]